MIKIYNRKTEKYDIEKVAAGKLLDLMYNSTFGKPGLELLVKRKLFSDLSGIYFDSSLSKSKIKSFIEQFEIDMSICRSKIEDFKCFNDFFTRELVASARVFNSDPNLLLSPGDGRIRVWSDIDEKKLFQVKGITYSLSELLGDEKLARKYRKGTCAILRLAPVDYHRFHFIDHGICSKSTKIKGWYYSVNPTALMSIPQIFCQNKREYSILHTQNFGDIIYVEVGATSVGSIIQTYNPDSAVSRGDAKGFFKFGGSTIILLFEAGKVMIDEDILMQTELDYECRVLAGEVIGKKA